MKYLVVTIIGVVLLVGAAHYGDQRIESVQTAEDVQLVLPAEVPGNSAEVTGATAGTAVVDSLPVSAVVVTQCNELLAAYLTLPSGELVRFDKDSGLSWVTVLDMANTAKRSERIEVSCNSEGVKGYEGNATPVSLTYM